MKAISLWQPWASAIALGLKRFETRSWACPASLIGQPLAIHAAKKRSDECRLRWIRHKMNLSLDAGPEGLPSDEITNAVRDYELLPFGAVICLVRVIKCWQTEDAIATPDTLTPAEVSWGDFTPGRFCWEVQKFYTFEKPIPCIGRQGLFDWNIPQEWIDAAAADAGMPGMAEIWKAVHK